MDYQVSMIASSGIGRDLLVNGSRACNDCRDIRLCVLLRDVLSLKLCSKGLGACSSPSFKGTIVMIRITSTYS